MTRNHPPSPSPRTRRTAAHDGNQGRESHLPQPSQLAPRIRNVPFVRVALVHDWLTGMRGGEKCLEVLCEAFPEATVHTLIYREGSLSPAIEAMTIKTSPLQRIPGVFRLYRHLLPIMPLAIRALAIQDVDLVVSLSHCVAKAVRPPAGVPHVCYCFTPMRYAWQGREAYLDGWRKRPVRRAAAGFVLDLLRRWDRATAKRVSHFVAISRTIQERIAACYGRESRVIEPPVDVDFYTPAAVERGEAYLVVGALVPYKKVDHAVEACKRLGRPLVVIGAGPERDRLEALAGPRARFLGWQPDEVIRDHYRTCRALLFPGEEDFGIVPIEALACGAPVIALGRGGVAETVDDQVGRLYSEARSEGLARALEGWERDGRPHDPGLARRRAEALSRSVFRERLLAYLAEVLAPGGDRAPAPRPHVGLTGGRAREARSV